MPLREAFLRLRKRSAGDWRTITLQVTIASGILAGIWATGWLLGRAFAAARPLAAFGAKLPSVHVLGRASVALAFGTLALVLGGVELLRLVVHRHPRRPVREPLPEARAAREWERVALLVALAVAADGGTALAQSAAPRLARADSAWAAGDSALAAREFAAVLAGDPDNSHATYRLAQLTRDNPDE